MADEQTASPQVIQRPRAEPSLPPAAGAQLKLLEDVLVALRRATKDIAFYPSGHPALQASLERVTAQIRKTLEFEDPLTFTITKDAIAHGLGVVGKANATVKAFAAELFLTQVRKVHIGSGFTLDDLTAFLGLATMDPKKVLMAGGPEAVLTAARAVNIQVNTLRFRLVGGDSPEEGGVGAQSGGKDMVDALAPAQGEEMREGPTQSPGTPGADTGEIVGGNLKGVDLLMQAANAAVLIEEESLTLEELLARLGAADEMEYPKVARRLDSVARNAMQQGETESFLRVMEAIARHRDDLDRPEKIRMAAARWLDGMVEAGCLDFLVDRICRKDAVHTDEIAALLGTLGEAAVGAMLQRLTAEEVMSARRRLIAAVVAQGDLALPQILRGLEDGRWFVVRNMAAILGELGTEGTVEALGHHVKHPDRRVRREVVRAIARVGGRHAPRFLRECLADADAVVRQAVIGFLGHARDSMALPPLMAMAEERARDKEGQDLRKSAIMALGQIGNRAAVPALARLVAARSWFRRGEPEDVRIAAAAALGLLGGPEAVEVLQGALRGGGRVAEACRHALDRLGA